MRAVAGMVGCVLFCAVAGLCFAQPTGGIQTLADGFYEDLAKIIEANMDDPATCVQKVDAYYREQQQVIQLIRQETQKALEQAAPAMEKMMSLSEEELQRLAEKQKQTQGSAQKQMSPAGQHYADALKNFSMRHPKQGMEIGMMALRLVPFSERQ